MRIRDLADELRCALLCESRCRKSEQYAEGDAESNETTHVRLLLRIGRREDVAIMRLMGGCQEAIEPYDLLAPGMHSAMMPGPWGPQSPGR